MFLSLIIAMLTCVSCSFNNNSNCSIEYVKLEFEYYKSIVDKGQYGYMIGTTGDSQDYRTKETIIYKRKGNTNFKLLDIRVPGENRETSFTDKHIYLINEIFTQKLSFSNSKTILYKVNLDTDELQKISELGNIYPKSVFFENDSVGYIFGRLSNYARDGGFMKTIDGGVSWDTLKLEKPIEKVKSIKKKFYFLSYKRNDKKDWIYTIDKKSNELDSLQFDLNIVDFTIGKNGDYWLLGKDTDRTVLQHYEDGKIANVKTFSKDADLSPNQLYRYNDVIVVLTSQIDKNMLGGFGGTKPEIFLSKDDGLTWDNQLVEEALYIKPVSFYEDERMTAYIGHGKVIKCSFN